MRESGVKFPWLVEKTVNDLWWRILFYNKQHAVDFNSLHRAPWRTWWLLFDTFCNLSCVSASDVRIAVAMRCKFMGNSCATLRLRYGDAVCNNFFFHKKTKEEKIDEKKNVSELHTLGEEMTATQPLRSRPSCAQAVTGDFHDQAGITSWFLSVSSVRTKFHKISNINHCSKQDIDPF